MGEEIASPSGSEIRWAHQLSWKAVEGQALYQAFDKEGQIWGLGQVQRKASHVHRVYWWGRGYTEQENNHPEWPDYTLCLPLIMLSYWSAGLLEEKKRHKLSVAGGVIKNL